MQFVDFHMGISEAKGVTTGVSDSGKTGKRMSIIHGHHKETVVNARIVFVGQRPKGRWSRHRDLGLSNESPIPIRVRFVLHVTTAHPTVHRITSYPWHSMHLRRIRRTTEGG